jgi:DNA-binding NarL/FixJ family response regulator
VSLRVVIVDDSEQFVEVARALLERDGFEVVGVASTVVGALELVSQLGPDMILIDVHLGTESGLDVARRVHEEISGARPTAILMSTHSEADLASLIDGVPVAGFVSKSDLTAAAINDVRRRASQ